MKVGVVGRMSTILLYYEKPTMYICAKGVFHACRITIIKVMSMWVSALGYNHMYTCTYVHPYIMCGPVYKISNLMFA